MAERTESFHVDRGGGLVRAVTPEHGRPYRHRCTLPSLQRVCDRFDERRVGETVETLAAGAQVPVTQAATALAFLLERGIVATERRCNFAATESVRLDAMTEYHALREKGPADPAFGYE
ncbi:MAG: hypothetical protein KJZ54_10385 [Phycisphaerales bacterium]|nr:hypothetical protein [Phycisphaerales bacterium]